MGASDAPPVEYAVRTSRPRLLMPVARSQGHAGKALLVAGIGVAVAMGLAFAIARLASDGRVELRFGDGRFEVGRAQALADRIADDGLPRLYPDLAGRGRPLYVHHAGGDDPRFGWRAFGAFDPAEPECVVELDPEQRLLVNACDPELTYPLHGEGLREYPTSVEDGRLYVDINELTTTSTTTTTTPPSG